MSGVLVIGASGLVGQHLLHTLHERGVPTVGTSRTPPPGPLRPLDIGDAATVMALLEMVRPTTIYLAAALSHVDYCETHADESHALNVLGTRNVALAAATVDARLVYFSTDYVFDGRAGPYAETDAPNPLNVYGRHKLLAEHFVLALAPRALVVRTTVVYGPETGRKNFVYRLLATVGNGQPLDVPADQFGSPTYAPNLAVATVTLATSGVQGLCHVSGPAGVSRYQFACEAAARLGLATDLIRPVPTARLGQRAPRPLRAGLRCDRATELLGIPLIDHVAGIDLFARELQR